MGKKKNEPPSIAEWLQEHLAPFSDKTKRTGITSKYPSGKGRKPILLYFVKMAFFGTFPADGLDPVGYPLDPQSQSKYFITSWRVMWTSFLGIPNRILFGKDELQKKVSKKGVVLDDRDPNTSSARKEVGYKQILKNIFGWHRKDSPKYHKFFNYTLIVPLLRAVWNTIKIVGTAAWNTLKLFTEFFPYAIELLCYRWIAGLKNDFDERSNRPSSSWDRFIMTLDIIGIALCGISYYVCKTCRIIGRMITSPGESVRHAWYEGNKLKGRTGKVVGGLLAFFSGLFTVAIYIIVFPLGVKAVIAHGPSFISTLVGKVSAWAESSTFVRRFGEGILQVLQPFVDGIRKIFHINETASSTLSPEVAASTSAFYLSVVVPLNRFFKRCMNWWHKQATETTEPLKDLKEPLLGDQQARSSSLSASQDVTQAVSNMDSALNNSNAASQNVDDHSRRSISNIPVASTTQQEEKSSDSSNENAILSSSSEDGDEHNTGVAAQNG